MHCGASSTSPYLHRPLPCHAEASMKSISLRARLLLQSDLFDGAAAPAPLTSLQLHRDELVDLLSQLLWQVASRADAAQRPEDDDEQDQP
jgi:hypothetical protein